MVLGSEKNEIKENYQISLFLHYYEILMTIKNSAGLHVSALYRFLLSAWTRWCLQLYNHFCLAV